MDMPANWLFIDTSVNTRFAERRATIDLTKTVAVGYIIDGVGDTSHHGLQEHD
jgi:hypothetical protein